jgi:hypothetical protein
MTGIARALLENVRNINIKGKRFNEAHEEFSLRIRFLKMKAGFSEYARTQRLGGQPSITKAGGYSTYETKVKAHLIPGDFLERSQASYG